MANKFKEKQTLAEILNTLYTSVEEMETECRREYRRVGTTEEQDTNWRTGELLWEDEAHTIPKMKDKWEYVMKSEEDMSEDDFIRLKMCQYVKAQLEKMI